MRTFGVLLLITLFAGICPGEESPRPAFHFTPERNWLNDPNGLVFHDGEWHLFYQYNPEGIESANKSWAHSVSKDLVHWEPLPLAIRYGEGLEIWSGSAVVDAANTSGFGTKDAPPLVALYTGAGHGKQAQYLAYSTDRGRTWTKFAGNPVLDENLKEFRDPKVRWHEPTKQWVMVVALSDQRKVRFYGSPDLKKWSLLSEFGGQGCVEGIWECPDLFPLKLGDKMHWVLVVNVGWGGPASGMSTAQYFAGDFDGTTFHNANGKDVKLWADYGPDFYAVQTWSNVPASDGRTLSIAWMSSPRYAGDEPTNPWRGGMTLPREVSLVETKDGPRLAQTPVRELAVLREKELAPAEWPTAGDTFEVEATLDLGKSASFTIASDRKGFATIVGYDADRRQVYVDRRDARQGKPFHRDFPGRYAAPIITGKDGTLPLRIFVDRSSVEVFADDGLSVLTVNTFPDPVTVGFRAPEDVQIKLWRLKSIWNKASKE